MVQISFIMPAYNVEDSINQSVQGILQQNIQDFELIIINDGSIDRTKEIIEQLTAQDSRIKAIHQKNGGPSAARNAGLDVATGNFIAFVDGDDEVEKDMYSTTIKKMEEEKADIGIRNVARINQKGKRILNSGNFTSQKTEEVLHKYFIWNGVEFYVWNKVYRSFIFDTVRFPVGVLYEDVMLSYDALKAASKVTISDRVGYNYLDNPVSIVNQSFGERQYDNVTQRIKLLDEVSKDFPNMTEYALVNLVDGFLSTGFKLSLAKKDQTRKKYLDRLNKDIKNYQSEIITSKLTSKAKLAALALLKMNITMYGYLYKIVLKK